MKLIKMCYDGVKVTCAVSPLWDGERTVCGNVYFLHGQAEFGEDDYYTIGDVFEGKLKDVTCSSCIQTIKFIKGLE